MLAVLALGGIMITKKLLMPLIMSRVAPEPGCNVLCRVCMGVCHHICVEHKGAVLSTVVLCLWCLEAMTYLHQLPICGCQASCSTPPSLCYMVSPYASSYVRSGDTSISLSSADALQGCSVQ